MTTEEFLELKTLLLNIRCRFHGMSSAFALANNSETKVVLNPASCENMLREGIKWTQRAITLLKIEE